MARKYFGIVVALMVAILGASAVAQSNEVAGTIGRTFIPDQTINSANTIHFGHGLTFEANYSHRLLNVGVFGISVEVPFVVESKEKLQYNLNVVPYSYKSYFVTPAVRADLFPTTAFSPWVSVGGGFGHFIPSDVLEFNNTPNPSQSSTTGVFEIGGGLDVRVIGNFKIRGEIRDFYSGEPPININSGSRYSNLYAAAGVVFSF